ncbi:YcxB family protein [Paenibacillus sp. IB182496]|uniref:YcxB family protein n=1 Tax=Paenibacillus sabuli TaxID=2772509 RepID=A0A927BT95_9BACL|nr:YcxB family protein [Paenibacillus sabuli]MBD2845018.1 YcxB family protein [Paenibacillus sabuli]
MSESVEFVTSYEGEEFKAFKRFQVFRRHRVLVRMFIFVLIAAGLYMGIRRADWLTGVLLIGIGLFTPMALGWVTNWMAKRQSKRLRKQGGITCTYRVERDWLFNETDFEGVKTTSATGWGNVVYVYETEESFYLYIKKKEPVILPKQALVAGTSFDARLLLWDVTRHKYKKLN